MAVGGSAEPQLPGQKRAMRELLADFSLGLPVKDVGDLERVRALVPAGSRIDVGFVDSEDLAMRVATARAIRQAGFVPVPVIAARRLRSEGMLREYLVELRAADASRSVLVVAGDPDPPRGPYPDAISIIGSGALEEYGVREVSVAGHPAGRSAAPDHVLWEALAAKAAQLEGRGLVGSVTTQFDLDPDLVLAWLAAVRTRDIRLPVRVGVPGPTSARRLLWYASQCDVSVSAAAARKYGLSLADPSGIAAPDRFLQALAAGYDERLHGEVRLHFFTFGGFAATTEWVNQLLAQ